ncbi:peptidoglycan recognition protein family protein [Enemella evansiae]|uniref:peptidoglycan recognition protein family protein n=1 Tax=Enemella evansiae TaxID=2016499 RepID=UPI0010E8AED1|nr:N-acetylmuramoyl-L-alanine amidase [Enemella evansiae]TDO92508.1 peptidoglycan hydrolase-like protein with peptidoglycan-binding domain [Enemella evansiae]
MNTPITQPRLSRRALIGGAAAVGTVAALGIGGAAYAAVARPRIYTTAQWGARNPDRRLNTLGYRPTYVVIHHTATQNVSDTSQAQAFRLSRQIQNWHMDKGWGDSGQHFTVSRGGVVMEARHGSLAAAIGGKNFIEGIHAPGSNRTGIGIENEGTYTAQLPPAAQRRALVQLVAWLCQQYKIPVSQIIGHRDSIGSSTVCPGDTFHKDLARFRSEVAKVLGGGGTPTPPPPPPPADSWPVLKRGSTGDAVRTAQHLLRHHRAAGGLQVDGSFGPATQTAVTTFQRAQRLSADGVIGPKTWPKLAVVARRGATGDLARAVQFALNTAGARIAVDGSFGPKTLAAVKAYQTREKLEVDGIVGPLTWRSLLAG